MTFSRAFCFMLVLGLLFNFSCRKGTESSKQKGVSKPAQVAKVTEQASIPKKPAVKETIQKKEEKAFPLQAPKKKEIVLPKAEKKPEAAPPPAMVSPPQDLPNSKQEFIINPEQAPSPPEEKKVQEDIQEVIQEKMQEEIHREALPVYSVKSPDGKCLIEYGGTVSNGKKEEWLRSVDPETNHVLWEKGEAGLYPNASIDFSKEKDYFILANLHEKEVPSGASNPIRLYSCKEGFIRNINKGRARDVEILRILFHVDWGFSPPTSELR